MTIQFNSSMESTMNARGTILLSEIERLAGEVDHVYNNLVLPGWGGPMHGLPDTLYGYVMGVLARIDLMSCYWVGGKTESQTKRMLGFMYKYLGADPLASALLIQVWRHKLMHTSAPRPVTYEPTGRAYRWLLHWGDEHLPREQHLKIQPNGYVFSVSLVGLLSDLRIMSDRYVTEMRLSQELAQNFDSYDQDLALGRFRVIHSSSAA